MSIFNYSVFVSHSSADFDLVTAIQDAARPIGVTVYTFEQDLQPGAHLPAKLLERVAGCDAMVAVLTQTAAASPAVNQEIGAARQAGKTVIPLVEPGVDTSKLTFLQGIENLPLNLANPTETLVKLSGRLARLKAESERAMWMLVVAGVAIWAASKK